jgi:putative DNA primase/helicase
MATFKEKIKGFEELFDRSVPPNMRALWIAQEYASAGIRVFPLRANKIPCVREWPTAATTNAEQLEAWFLRSSFAEAATCVGISCGANDLVVLDGDKKPGKEDGVANLYALYAEHGIDVRGVPVTISPSGSEHHYFKMPVGVRIGCGRGKLPPQIDVRGDGGQVVLPPSIGAKGAYKTKRGAPSLITAWRGRAIPELPKALVDLIGAKRERAACKTNPLLPLELVERILEEIPNEPGGYFDDRQTWVEFGLSVYAASGGLLFGEWLQWNEPWGGDPEKDAAFWETVDPKQLRAGLGKIKQALQHFGRQDLLRDIKTVETKRAFGFEVDLEALATAEADARRQEREARADETYHVADPLAPTKANASVRLVNGGDVVPEKIDWIWNGYLARGKMHLLAGPSTAGKTTVSLALAAAITTGGKWPDGTRCEGAGDVLIWSGEDGRADTLAPRLRAAGADMRRVHFVDVILEGGEPRAFDPSRDFDALSRALDAPGLKGKVRLVIVDSLASAVAGDAHRNNEVRRGLQPVVDLAERHGAAVLGIVHFSKGTQGRNVLERVNGSLAFGALARILLICAVEEREDGPNRLLFVRGPSNIGPSGGGWEYTLELRQVPGRPDIECTAAKFGDAITGSANAILAKAEGVDGEKRGQLAEAVAFLRQELKDGPVTWREIWDHAKAEGISERTLKRAKSELGAVTEKIGRVWSWRLKPLAEVFSNDGEADDPF